MIDTAIYLGDSPRDAPEQGAGSLFHTGNSLDLGASAPSPCHYRVPVGTVSKIRGQVNLNNMAAATALRLYKNGVATGLFVSIGAGATGSFTATSATVTFADDDALDLAFEFDSAAEDQKQIQLSAIVEFRPS